MAPCTEASATAPVRAENAPEQRGVGQRAPEVLAGHLGGRHGDQSAEGQALLQVVQAQLSHATRGVDQDVAPLAQTAEHVDLVQQGGVADDHHVRGVDRIVGADRRVVQAAERDHGRAHALGAEAGDGLRVLTFDEGGDR